jgi:hypothetical protein
MFDGFILHSRFNPGNSRRSGGVARTSSSHRRAGPGCIDGTIRTGMVIESGVKPLKRARADGIAT